MAQPDPGLPTPVGSFSITELRLTTDKVGKDTNFRGLTISNNVIYTTKGRGSNGINKVYFIDTTGFDSTGRPLACPNGVGLPGANATLPTAPIYYDATKLQTLGVVPYNMCILKGFPTTLAKVKTATAFPFGLCSLPAGESFTAIQTARFGEVLRGVSFTPGTDRDRLADADDHRDDDHGHDHQ